MSKREILDALLSLPPSSPHWGYDNATGVHYLVDGWRIASVVERAGQSHYTVAWGGTDTEGTRDTLAEAKRVCEAYPSDPEANLVRRRELVDLLLGPGDNDPDVQ